MRHQMLLRKNFFPLCGLLFVLTLFSCRTKKAFEPISMKQVPPVMMTYNYYEYTIQNMDENAKCDAGSLTAFYDGFNVMFSLNENRQMLFTIENKTNKSFIIDKAKCYVLYDGYSHDLFKDVRTGKVTTYNNVQDAINSVQTNESSVTMSIPPYSKWKLPIPETNITKSAFPKRVETIVGDYPLTTFTTNATIEFVIPYTFDYSLAKWNTIRNKLFINNIHVEKKSVLLPDRYHREYGVLTTKLYYAFAQEEDLVEYDEVNAYNERVRASNYGRFFVP